MLGKIIITVFIIYFGYYIFKGFFSKEPPKTEVKGRNKNQPMDLRQEDVEDAKFEEIKED
jgi:hypothetical protein